MAGGHPRSTGGTKPAVTVDAGPTIKYESTTVNINSLIRQLEHLDNIAHSENRKVVRDGVRACLKKQGKEPLDSMIFLLKSILGKLEGIRREL